MATAWQDITGRALANVADSRSEAAAQWTSSETSSENFKLSAAMKAVMAEFLIRWPCPAAADEEHHLARMLLLFSDCRDLSPGMMRKAGDYVARIPNRPTVMPSASEITGAVEAIMADRAAKQAAMQRQEWQEARPANRPQMDTRLIRHAEINRNRSDGFAVADDGSMFRMGCDERRGIRADGTVIAPWFHHAKGDDDAVPPGWYCRQEDAAALADCYRRFGSQYRLRGCMIVEV